MSNVTEFPRKAIIEEEACLWIVKFEGDNEPSKHDIEQFNDWLAKSPLHRKTLLDLSHTWNDMDLMSGLMIPLGQSAKPKRGKLEIMAIVPLLMVAVVYKWFANIAVQLLRPVVALPTIALIMTISLSFWLFDQQSGPTNNVYVTTIGNHSTHTLQDGSVLWLNSNSQVEVNYTNAKRIITLVKGEAHFNVEHDANRPFEVYAGRRIVKAIGTAFSVYRSNDKLEVMVSQGRVELAIVEPAMEQHEEASSFKVINQDKTKTSTNLKAYGKMTVIASLQKGQSVSLSSTANTLHTPVVEHAVGELARKLSWLEGTLVFAGESLDEVVAEVSRHTSVVIEVADPNLRKLRIGGQFKAGETEALFDVLESGFGVKITRISKNRVRIDAK